MDPTALGRYLRESREAKELTLEDAVRSLHIRREVFESFEQGNFEVTDSPVRIRGMLRNYARFIGLEEERVLQYYEAAQNQKRRIRRRFGRREDRTEPIAPRNITDTPPSLPAINIPSARRRFDFGGFLRNIAFILVSIAAITVIIFVAYNLLDVNSLLNDGSALPTQINNSGTVTPTDTPSITPSTLEASSTPDSFARGILDVQILLEMTQRSYLRLLVDENEIFAGIMEPGESMRLEGSESVQIVAANAAALHIIYNDVEQELFGGRGQQVDLRFTNNGAEVSLGEGGLSSTVSPTSFLNEATEDIEIATISQESSPTALISTVLSPTPFLADSSIATAAEITQSNPATAEIQATATMMSNTATPSPTASPTVTATSMILLPPRETPSNPTPTKP